MRWILQSIRAWGIPRAPSATATLFLVSLLSFASFYQGGGQNEAARFDADRALIDEGRLVIDSYTANSADVVTVNGHVYSGKAPGTFYLALPFFAATEGLLRIFHVDEDVLYHWVCYVSTVLTISLLGALTVVMMYWFGLRLGAVPADSAAVALSIGFATMFFPFSTVFFSHVAAAFCLFFAFYQFFAHRQILAHDHRAEAILGARWRLLAAGTALGFSITLEYPSAIGAGLIGLYWLLAIWKFRARKDVAAAELFVVIICGGIAGLLPLFVYNWYAFHNPFYITYEAYSTATNTAFEAHKKGILGIRIPLLDPSAWPQFFSNLREIMYRPLRGLFFLNPILLMIGPGFYLAFRARKHRLETWLTLGIFLAYVIFNASFGDSITYWGGGASFGPRYLIVSLPFFVLVLLKTLDGASWRGVFAGLALLSAFLCLMATAIDPRTPYSPPNPVFYFYFPRFITGFLALNPIGIFSAAPLVDRAVSFTWGGLMGLPRQLQLFPLYGIWLLGAWHLDRIFGVHASPGSRGHASNHGSSLLMVVGALVFVAAWLQIGGLFQG